MRVRSLFPVPLVPLVRQKGSVPYRLITGAILIAALYFGRDVFVPLAIAVLLSFVLAPLADRIQALRLGRVASVLVVVIVTFLGLLSLLGYVGTQVAQLAADLPTYQNTIQEKIRTLRGASSGTGTLQRAGTVLQKLDAELNNDPATKLGTLENSQATIPSGTAKPIPVEVHQPPPTMLESMGSIAAPFLHPLAMIAIVLVFVIFILLQREDIRDRLIRLAGSHDLQRTTAAIDDAARSLSKYFLAQIGVNATFGIVVGIGLSIIGVPNPVLWGTLAAVLRFVPYIGSVIAATLPILVAAAVDPGWSLAVWTAGLILVLELLAGQVIEPMVYGRSSGISPLAVVISATLWTALWGPVGLLLATPLTICLVVLGRHVDQLEFLDVILGNKPPLTPAQNFYQRLLANDPEEAAAQAETFLKGKRLSTYYDEVALKGLELAQIDLSRGAFDGAKVVDMKTSVEAIVDDLSDHEDSSAAGDVSSDAGDSTSVRNDHQQQVELVSARGRRGAGNTVLCVGGRSALDDAASALLANLIERERFETRIVGYDTLSVAGLSRLDPIGVAMICVSYLDVSSLAHLRFAVRRLRRRAPGAKVLVGCWGQTPATAEEMAKAAKADFSATSLQGAVQICLSGPSGDVHADPARDVPLPKVA
jgi:predicted PurR-regulated permease PerM